MLKGKCAVITGSTSGIGHGIACALADAGVSVVLNGLGSADDNKAAIDAAAARAKAAGARALFHPANMLKPAEIVDMVAFATKELGAVDILVNNAGIQHVAPVEEFPVEKWDAIIAINLTAAFHAIKAVLPAMKARRWGRIINTASAHSLVASPHKSAYVTAKHGLAGLTKTIALEAAEHGVTCNAISPGFVWTPLVAKQIPDLAKTRGMSEDEVKQKVLLASQPTKAFVQTEEVAALAVFLCGDQAASITGANLPIDGGWTAA